MSARIPRKKKAKEDGVFLNVNNKEFMDLLNATALNQTMDPDRASCQLWEYISKTFFDDRNGGNEFTTTNENKADNTTSVVTHTFETRLASQRAYSAEIQKAHEKMNVHNGPYMPNIDENPSILLVEVDERVMTKNHSSEPPTIEKRTLINIVVECVGTSAARAAVAAALTSSSSSSSASPPSHTFTPQDLEDDWKRARNAAVLHAAAAQSENGDDGPILTMVMVGSQVEILVCAAQVAMRIPGLRDFLDLGKGTDRERLESFLTHWGDRAWDTSTPQEVPQEVLQEVPQEVRKMKQEREKEFEAVLAMIENKIQSMEDLDWDRALEMFTTYFAVYSVGCRN